MLLFQMRRVSKAAKFLALPLSASAFLFIAIPAQAEIRHKTTEHKYKVYGNNASELVSYMLRRPMRGDFGSAIASISTRYKLKIKTDRTADQCRMRSMLQDIKFKITLPHAARERRLSSKDKLAFRDLRAFSRIHEETHRQIYLECAAEFEQKALRLRAGTCQALGVKLQRLQERHFEKCNRRHDEFDRRDSKRIFSQELFQRAAIGKPPKKSRLWK